MTEQHVEHPLAAAVKPLLAAVGATPVPLDEAKAEDVVLEWEGTPALAVRLPHLSSALDRLLAEMTRQFDGRPLAELDRWRSSGWSPSWRSAAPSPSATGSRRSPRPWASAVSPCTTT